MKYLIKTIIAVMLLFTLQLTGEEPNLSVNSDQFIQIPQKELRKFTGIYCNEKSDVIRIKQKDGKLFFINSMYEKQELKAVSSTKFLLDKSSPQAYYEFSLKKNKVEKFVTQDFKRNTKSEFAKVGHFAFYHKYYISLLIAIALMILFYIMKKKGFKTAIYSYHWMDSDGSVHYHNNLEGDFAVPVSPKMEDILDEDNWFDKLFDRLHGKTKK